jgi:hypothetical protein
MALSSQSVTTIELGEPVPLQRTHAFNYDDIQIEIPEFHPTDELNSFIVNYRSTSRIGLRNPSEVIMELVDMGADINNVEMDDRTLLTHCAIANDVELLTALLSNGADIRAKNSEDKDMVDIILEEDITLSGDTFVILTNAFSN